MEGAEKSAGAVAERHKDEVDMTMDIQKVISTHCTEGQGKITARLATPSAPERPSKRAMVEDQVVVGTSGTMKLYMTFNATCTKTVIVDEADGMFDQHETGRLQDTKKMLKIINPSGGNCQVILLSETSSERVKRSAMKEFREVGSWSSVVLEKPSHDLNCQYQIAQSCPETLSKISALKKDVDAAGITDTVGLNNPRTRPDMFLEGLTRLANGSTDCETSKLEFSKLRDQYQSDEDACKRLRKKVEDHNLEVSKKQTMKKASERKNLEALVNGKQRPSLQKSS